MGSLLPFGLLALAGRRKGCHAFLLARYQAKRGWEHRCAPVLAFLVAIRSCLLRLSPLSHLTYLPVHSSQVSHYSDTATPNPVWRESEAGEGGGEGLGWVRWLVTSRQGPSHGTAGNYC